MLLKKLALSSLLAASLFAGNYTVDPVHSHIAFKVKHMMINNVTGKFSDFSGKFEFDEKNVQLKQLSGEVRVKSLSTNNEKRDGHLLSPDFFDAKSFTKMHLETLAVTQDELIANLTIRGVTKKIVFELENGGSLKDPWGIQRAGFALTGKINRKDFGLVWNKVLEAGGVLVGDKIKLTIEIEGTKS